MNGVPACEMKKNCKVIKMSGEQTESVATAPLLRIPRRIQLHLLCHEIWVRLCGLHFCMFTRTANFFGSRLRAEDTILNNQRTLKAKISQRVYLYQGCASTVCLGNTFPIASHPVKMLLSESSVRKFGRTVCLLPRNHPCAVSRTSRRRQRSSIHVCIRSFVWACVRSLTTLLIDQVSHCDQLFCSGTTTLLDEAVAHRASS